MAGRKRLTLDDVMQRVEDVNSFYHDLNCNISRSAKLSGIGISVANKLLIAKSKWHAISELKYLDGDSYSILREDLFYSVIEKSPYSKILQRKSLQ